MSPELCAEDCAMNKMCLMLGLLLICLNLFVGNAYAGQDNSTFLLPSGVRVKITEAPFDKDKFKVSGCDENDQMCLINGRIPFGVESSIPHTYVKSISVSYQGHSYQLDTSDMYNAWGNRPLEVKGVIRYFGGQCADTKNCQFRGLFSDAAGTFVAEWKIIDGFPIRTVLTNSSDVVKLFMRHIDPPEFK